MEIAPGIHLLLDSIDATTLSVVLIDGGAAGAMVDTGLPVTPSRVLLPYLADLARPPGWLRTIVNSHCHTDHAAGNAEVRAATGARLLIHASEMAYVADPLAFVAMMQARYGDGRAAPPPDAATVREQYGPGSPADAGLEDGDLVAVGDRLWRVIHAPGHSQGCICLYEAATGTLITGDAVQVEGTTSCDLAFYFEAAAYGATLARVAALPVETVVAGHPFKPFPSAYLTGSEARRFIEVSQAAHGRYAARVTAILANATRPLSTGAVAEELTRQEGFTRCVGPAVQTTRAHLEQLRQQGQAERLYADGGWTWRARRA